MLKLKSPETWIASVGWQGCQGEMPTSGLPRSSSRSTQRTGAASPGREWASSRDTQRSGGAASPGREWASSRDTQGSGGAASPGREWIPSDVFMRASSPLSRQSSPRPRSVSTSLVSTHPQDRRLAQKPAEAHHRPACRLTRCLFAALSTTTPAPSDIGPHGPCSGQRPGHFPREPHTTHAMHVCGPVPVPHCTAARGAELLSQASSTLLAGAKRMGAIVPEAHLGDASATGGA
jgi:hypothetical protein